jgi:NitT/TauT family transport system permease protein
MSRQKFWSQVLFYAALVLVWQVLSSTGFWSEKVLPGPWAVAGRLGKFVTDGSLSQALFLSLGRVMVGYLLACVLGVSLGLLVFQWDAFSYSFGSMVPGLLSLPAACWLPLTAIWFAGKPEYAIQLMIILGAVFSIAHATENGMRQVQPVWVRAARTMGSRDWNLSLKVQLPAALPAILTGLKQGWTFAWRALMTGELLSTTLGFGNLLKQGQKDQDMAALFGLILVIIALGYTIDLLVFGPLERKIRLQFGLE